MNFSLIILIMRPGMPIKTLKMGFKKEGKS
jgi:hypothetical protein